MYKKVLILISALLFMNYLIVCDKIILNKCKIEFCFVKHVVGLWNLYVYLIALHNIGIAFMLYRQ